MRARLVGIALVALVFCDVETARAAAPLDSAKAVFVGHSLINYDVPDMLLSIAQSKGVSARRAAQILNGGSIRANWDLCRASAYLPDAIPWWELACDSIDAGTPGGPYDNLIITQVNNPIIHPSFPNETGTTAADYERFLNLFLTRNPSGRAFFYTAWEGIGSPWHQGAPWVDRIAPELAHYERITDEIEALALSLRGRSVQVHVLPVNLALRDLVLAIQAGQVPGLTSITELFSDDVHMRAVGNYFNACVVFASIYQQSPAGASGRTNNRWGLELTNLDTALALKLQNIAWDVVARYRGWSSAPAPRPRAPGSFSVQ